VEYPFGLSSFETSFSFGIGRKAHLRRHLRQTSTDIDRYRIGKHYAVTEDLWSAGELTVGFFMRVGGGMRLPDAGRPPMDNPLRAFEGKAGRLPTILMASVPAPRAELARG
jgi:hypothetical protein